MKRLTHERVNGIKTGKRAARESETKTATRMAECIAGAFRDGLEK